MEQRTGRQQVAFVQHALRQRISVYPRLHPAEQAHRLGCKGAARPHGELDAARTGGIEPGADAFGVAAQLPLLDAQGQGFLQ